MEYIVKKIDVQKDYVNVIAIDSNSCSYSFKIHAVAFANYYLRVDSIVNEVDFNNLLNNKYLVDSYYLILFVAFAFTISLGICEEQA